MTDSMINPDHAWAAGFLSTTGSIAQVGKTVRLTIRSTRHQEAVKRLADIAGGDARFLEINKKPGIDFQMSGKPLHALMTSVWGELTKERKLEYARARKAAAAVEAAEV